MVVLAESRAALTVSRPLSSGRDADVSYMPKIVRLIRRRTLAYELLAEYDAENLPVDPERFKRALATITAYGRVADASAGGESGHDRWRAAIEATHGLSRRDGMRP